MKYLLILLFSFCTTIISAQSYTQKGKTFIANDSVKTEQVTDYTWQYKGVSYPIYLSSRGKAYIYKTSKKTGKKYKYYLPDNVALVIKH